MLRLRTGVTLALGLLGACEAPKQPGPPATPAAAPIPTPSPASSSKEAAPSAVEDRAIAELKAKAKMALRADRTVVENRLGYEQAVKRHARDAQGTGQADRLPMGPLLLQQVELALVEHLEKHELKAVEVTLGAAEAGPPLPAEHVGEGPYPWKVDQFIERRPLVLTVTSDDPKRLEPFFRAISTRCSLLLELVSVQLQEGKARFTGYAYARRDVTPPTHVPTSPSLADLAKEAKVAVPTGHPRLPEVEALLAEHKALLPQLASSMAALGQAHLAGRVFQFYRTRVEEIGRRSFPKPIGP